MLERAARLTLLSLCAVAACAVDRRLRIETDPPGADVTVDGKYLGASPLELHFTHYGERRVRVAKRGYATIEQVVALEAPWYGHFPIDVVVEVIVPVWRTDFRAERFALVQQADQPGLTAAELRHEEDAAVARGRELGLWLPGEPLPVMAASRPAGAASRPASADSRPSPPR